MIAGGLWVTGIAMGVAMYFIAVEISDERARDITSRESWKVVGYTIAPVVVFLTIAGLVMPKPPCPPT